MKTNNLGSAILAVLLISSVSFGLVGCNKNSTEKSDAELKKDFTPHPPPADLQKKMEEAQKATMQNRGRATGSTTAPTQ